MGYQISNRIEEKQSSNAYVVSYVDFNGKMITRTYDRHLNNEKK